MTIRHHVSAVLEAAPATPRRTAGGGVRRSYGARARFSPDPWRWTIMACRPWPETSRVEVAPRAHHLVFRNFSAEALPVRLSGFQSGSNEYLFNSYYNQVGAAISHGPRRGLLSRPTVEEVLGYRAHVDAAMTALLADVDEVQWSDISARTTLRLASMKNSHTELFADRYQVQPFGQPLKPAYYDDLASIPARRWRRVQAGSSQPGGIQEIGPTAWVCVRQRGSTSSCADCRTTRWPFARLVTNGEYLAFIETGG